MILWTIQPLTVWRLIQENGVYRCDTTLSSMHALEIAEKYEWLVGRMIRKIGLPPDGVTYPIWAWYMQNGKRKKPDLRTERWRYGTGEEDYTCIELEIPDEQVLLSDFEAWHIILNDGLFADSEEEADRNDAYYASLSAENKKTFKEENWDKVFDIAPFTNDWTRRGEWVQATFWELRKEMVRHVRFFRTGKLK